MNSLARRMRARRDARDLYRVLRTADPAMRQELQSMRTRVGS